MRGGLRSSQDTRRAAGSVASVARRDGDIRRTAINPASAVATGFERYPRTVVFCSSNAFLPVDVSVEGYFRHLRLIKRAMSVRVLARMAELAIWSSLQTSPYEEEMKSALSVPELVMEINSRTLVRLLSERLPKQGRRVLGLLLSGCSPEMTARMLGTGVRQVWLAEQTLKQRWDIPTGVPLSDAVRIRIPDVGPDISQQSALVKTGADNAPDLC